MTTFCEWPVDYLECDNDTPGAGDSPIGFPGDESGETEVNLEELDSVEREKVEDMAGRLLWEWTGRIFGICEVTVRPCRERCADTYHSSTYFDGPGGLLRGSGYVPVLIDGRWFNLMCGQCNRSQCACTPGQPVFRVLLPGPVNEIVRVVIDGSDLPPENYRLEGRALVRTDGEPWPSCQNLNQDKDEVGSWYVTYKRGIEVPAGGQIAAGVLANELYKALCNDQSCQLPQRVQTVTRQGVTVGILDSFEDVREGRTGIWSVDAWIASVNAPQKRPGRVYSPDLR